ncbi:hypothetical protein PL10110_250117 [Planktothrix agardhii]|nr:hypothetical protein PL10110_250117 [Planktothrix agardhii]
MFFENTCGNMAAFFTVNQFEESSPAFEGLTGLTAWVKLNLS